jgi:hypothetical protein
MAIKTNQKAKIKRQKSKIRVIDPTSDASFGRRTALRGLIFDF